MSDATLYIDLVGLVVRADGAFAVACAVLVLTMIIFRVSVHVYPKSSYRHGVSLASGFSDQLHIKNDQDAAGDAVERALDRQLAQQGHQRPN